MDQNFLSAYGTFFLEILAIYLHLKRTHRKHLWEIAKNGNFDEGRILGFGENPDPLAHPTNSEMGERVWGKL